MPSLPVGHNVAVVIVTLKGLHCVHLGKVISSRTQIKSCRFSAGLQVLTKKKIAERSKPSGKPHPNPSGKEEYEAA